MSFISLKSQAEDIANSTEQKKNIVKTFSVSKNDNLLIENTFGSVNVNLWDKDEVRVEIQIKADANSDERTKCLLDGIQITEKRADNQIGLRTSVKTDECSSMFSWQNSKNTIQINYTVSMPKYMPLSVRNTFGNTNIPTFMAALAVDAKHGNFVAHHLGKQNKIDVAFGKAVIDRIERGSFNISHSTFDLEKGGIIVLNNRFGKLNIGEVVELEGQIGHSGTNIGVIKNNCKVKVDFANSFRVGEMPESVENVDIQASHSNLTLPQTDDCSFDVTVTHGNFYYATNRKIVFKQNDDTEERSNRAYGPRFTKQYVGHNGRGSGAKIKVIATFGDINLK